jgi:DNA-binding beta-propeller fold protein YncE
MRSTATLVPCLRALTTAFCLFATPSAALSAQTRAGASYHVARDLTLGGDGRWDYVVVDTANDRLFIARQTRVMVVDPDSGKLLGEIPGLNGAHGVALAYAAGHGFATSGHDSSVTMFDLKTLRVLGRTKAADDADAILYDPASKRVFTFNGDANSASVIDPVSGKLLGGIPLGGKPEFGVTTGHGRLYVNLEDKAELVEIDPAAMRVLRRWSLAPCEEPTGLAIDRDHHLLFSGCHNKLMAISNAAEGKMIGQVPIGGGVDAGAFDPSSQLAFTSNGDGTLTVVHEDSPTRFRVVANVITRPGARTMALDERTHRIYTVTAAFGPAPAPTSSEPHPRPSLVPGTFSLLVLDR